MSLQQVPGLNVPTQTGMLAGNPRDSAIAAQAASTAKLAALNKAVGGAAQTGLWRDLDIQSIRSVGGRRNRYSRQSTSTTTSYRRRRHRATKRRHRRHCHRVKVGSRGSQCRCHCSCHNCRTMCRYRRINIHKGGADAATVQVPQFTMQYTPTGGPGQTPNDLIKQNSQISTQSAANAVFDKYAGQR